MDNNLQLIDGKIVKEYTEAELDAQMVRLQEDITALQAIFDSYQAIKDSI